MECCWSARLRAICVCRCLQSIRKLAKNGVRFRGVTPYEEKNEVGFRLRGYDRTRPLIIDPTIVYAGLIGGGTNTSYGQAITVDSSGNAYITGYTNASDFPLLNAAYSQIHGAPDAFVTKINSGGTALLYSTYVGGAGSDIFYGIAVDSAGQAWVTGSSSSGDFPVVSAYQPRLIGSQDAVVMKLGASGNVLYSTYFGLSGSVNGRGIALDASGNAYVTGYISPGSVPATLGAFQASPQGGEDAFAAKFSTSGTLVYCTYLGGTSDDIGNAIAVDSAGNAYIAGSSDSSSFSGAPAGGAQTSNHGLFDAFVAKLNPTGTGLAYFTFLGGSSDDRAEALAVDASGNAYAGGYTSSTDLATTPSVLQAAYGGGSSDGFVAKLNSTGSSFTYVTYIGASRGDIVYGLAIDGAGDAFITGRTQSESFPTVSPIQGSLTGNPTSLFRSTSSGSSWSAFDGNIPGEIIDVLPDPATSGVIVAATDAGIFRSTNGGSTWTQTSTVPSAAVSRSLASSNTIYALSNGTSYRSADGGATWTTGANFGINAFASIVADPLTANTAYAAYTADTVYKTTNGGATWSPLNSGLTGFFVESLVASPDGSLYLDTNTLLYKSTNQGASWSFSSSSGLTSGGVPNGLSVAKSNPSVVYRISGGGVYKTLTGGTSWSIVSGSLPAPAQALAVSPSNASLVYAAISTSPGLPALYVSADGGATWNATGTGLGLASISKIVFDPLASGTLYVTAPTAQSAFVSEIDPTGGSLVYSTYLAGSSYSVGNGIAASSTGDAFVAGYSSGSFPATITAWQGDPTSIQAFIAEITGTTAACSYSVSPLAETIYSPAQAVDFTVLAPSGCAWTASSNQSWATFASGTSGSGSGSGVVDVTANTSGLARTATLTIGGHGFLLTQAPSSCSYALNASPSSVGGTGGPVSVTVTTAAGCPWSVVNNYPAALSVSGGSGTGNGTTNLTVGPSSAQGSRSLTVPIGSSSITIIQAGSLSVTKTHVGNFTIGQMGATYTVIVTNSSTEPTSGTVTMTEMAPAGLTLVSLAGTGWNCNSSSCSRNDALAAKASYPPITVTVNVSANAPSPQVNAVGVSIGGVTAAGAIDVTTIAPRPPLQFIPVTPCRIMDTRNSNGPLGGPFIPASATRSIPVPSSPCGVPGNAVAYSLNFTVVPRSSTLSYLTVWPTGQPQPLVSTLNSPDASVLANAAIVPAGTGGAINAFVTNDTDLVVDVNGYFAPPATGTLQFYSLTPCRILDTRNANGTFGGPAIAGGTSRSFPVRSSACGVPATAAAYSLNLTVVPQGLLGYVTSWPTGQPQPLVSTLNSLDGTVLANAAIVPAGTNGEVSFFAANTTDLVVDINGYFGPPGTGGLNFYTVTPCRIVDTRNPNGTFGGPVENGATTRTFPLSQGACGLPSNTAAYSLNMTVVPFGFLGYLTTWPAGGSQPVVSTLNAYKGQVVANAALVPAGVNGAVNVYVTNTTYVVIDTNGYFAQ